MKSIHLGALSAPVLVFLPLFVLLNFSCDNPEYVSPDPGVIEIRFKTVPGHIEFNPLNSFLLKVSDVQAIRFDDARVTVYEDVKAIGRTPNQYDVLSVRARDSSLIIGQYFVPPADYKSFSLSFEPGTEVILDGYRHIPVVRGWSGTPGVRAVFERPFEIRSGDTTRITLSYLLDNSLVKGAENYYFLLQNAFYISSIR